MAKNSIFRKNPIGSKNNAYSGLFNTTLFMKYAIDETLGGFTCGK